MTTYSESTQTPHKLRQHIILIIAVINKGKKSTKNEIKWCHIPLFIGDKLIILPVPFKVGGGYVFTPVYLSVCEQDISKSYERIRPKLGGQVVIA